MPGPTGAAGPTVPDDTDGTVNEVFQKAASTVVAEIRDYASLDWEQDASTFSGWSTQIGVVPSFNKFRFAVKERLGDATPPTTVIVWIREGGYQGAILHTETLNWGDRDGNGIFTVLTDITITSTDSLWLQYKADDQSSPWMSLSGNGLDTEGHYSTGGNQDPATWTSTSAGRRIWAEFYNEAVELTPQGEGVVVPDSMYKTLANVGQRGYWTAATNVLYIYDSFGDGAADIPNQAISISGIAGDFSTTSITGTRLDEIPTVLNGFDLTSFDTVVIGRGVNDIDQGATLTELKSRVMYIIMLFSDVQVIVQNLPPLSESATYTAAYQAKIDEYNTWLDTLFLPESSKRIFDINSVVDTTGDNNTDPAYAAGSGNIHLNAAGSIAAATVLATLLT